MRRRAHLLWLLVPLAALALPGCGDTVSLDPVAKAADRTSAAGTAHVVVTGTVVTGGVSVSMSGSGDFDNARRLGSLTMTVTGGPQTGTMTEVFDNWTIYMSSPLFGRVPGGKHWLSIDLEQAGKALGIDFAQYSGTNPAAALQLLEKAADVVKVGTETIDGVAATHYHATVDVSRLPNGSHLAELTGLSTYPVDVWIGHDGLVRRLRLSLATHPSTVGVPAMQMTIAMDYSNFGETVDVHPPAASDTIDLTKLAKQGLGSAAG
jgi:hypothetical protein